MTHVAQLVGRRPAHRKVAGLILVRVPCPGFRVRSPVEGIQEGASQSMFCSHIMFLPLLLPPFLSLKIYF